jgi:hypothetical protein
LSAPAGEAPAYYEAFPRREVIAMGYMNIDGEYEPDEPVYDRKPTFEDGVKLGRSLGYLEGYTKGLRFGLAKAGNGAATEQHQ